MKGIWLMNDKSGIAVHKGFHIGPVRLTVLEMDRPAVMSNLLVVSNFAQ